MVRSLARGGEVPSHPVKGVRLRVAPEEARWVRFDIIRSFDRPLMSTEITDKIDASLVTELDWQIYKLQRK